MSVSPRRVVSVALPLLLALGVLAACAPASVDDAIGMTDDDATAAIVDTPSPHATPHVRVVTVGDSLMAGYGLSRSKAWPELLAKEDHFSLVNLACGGMGFVVAGDCGTPYSGLVPAVIALDPELVIIQSSSNDFGEDPDIIDQDTLATLEQLRAALPDVPIVTLSTIWNDESELPDEVAITSDALASASTEIGGTYLDVGQPLAGHPEWMQFDDVHPTAEGQRAIAAAIGAVLAAAGILPPQGS